MEISGQPKIPKQISEKPEKKISGSVEQGKGQQPRVEKKAEIPVQGQKLEKRSVEASTPPIVPGPELKTALEQAIELIKKNDPYFIIDFDNTLKVLATRSPEDQEKFIQELKEKFSYEEGWVSWGFKALQSRVASFYSLGTEGLSKTHEYASFLGEFAANMLTQARKDAINSVAESMPSLPSAVDAIIQSIGQRTKEAITNVISTPTFEKLMFLMLLPTNPLEESDEDLQKDAQAKIEDIEILIEKMSREIAEFYSLEEGKLEVLTDKMSEKFNETVIQSISTTASAISKFVMDTVSEATQKMLSREGMTNIFMKIAMCTVLMDAFGPQEALSGVSGRDQIAFGLPKNVEHLPGVLGQPYIEPGWLSPAQIKILVFCIMTLMKGRRPLFYPTSVFLSLKGPLAFVQKGGKGYIKALTAILTERQDLLAVSVKFFVGKLIELMVFKPVMRRSFENTLRTFCETVGLHNLQLFTKQGPTFEQIASTLIEFPEAIETFAPEELEKFIEGVENLSAQQKDNLLVQLSPEQMGKLPETIQEILFDLGTALIHLPNKEIRKFFREDLESLSKEKKESLFNDIREFSSQKKQALREKLYPMFNNLSFETRKQLYDALEFNLAEVLIYTNLPETFKMTVGSFIGEILKNPKKNEKKVFEQEINKLTLRETEKLIQKLGKVRGLSSATHDALHQALARHLREEKEKNEFDLDEPFF